MTDRTDIGSFKRTPTAPDKQTLSLGEQAIKGFMGGADPEAAAAPATSALPATPAPGKTLEARESNLEQAVSSVEDAPELTYAERVKKYGLSVEEAVGIVSAIFDNGWYEHKYQLTPKHSVVLRTRTTEDQDRVLRRIEGDNPQFPATISHILGKYNLASSMIQFKGIDMEKLEWKEKYDFVCKLPEVLLHLLTNKLFKFDQMIQEVVSEGAVQNF